MKEDSSLKMALEQIIAGQDRLYRQHETLAEGQAKIYERMDHLDDCIDTTRTQLQRRLDEIEKKLEGHVIQEAQQFGLVRDMIKSIVPDGDFDGHRMYHVGQMRKWQWWEKAKTSVIVDLLKLSASFVAGWVVLTLWGGFKIVVAN